MKRIAATLLFPPLMGAVTNLQVGGVTPAQAIVRYTSPDTGPCRVELSESSTFAPVLYDADAAKFSNADLDLNRSSTVVSGLARTVVFGKQKLDLALDGNWYSRALPADSKLYLRVGCGGGFADTATLSFATSTPPIGATHSLTFQSDASAPGAYITPYYSYTDRTQQLIDPQTGVKVKPFSLPRDQNRDASGGFNVTESCTGWTNPDNMLSDADSSAFAEYPGTSQDWCTIRVNVTAWHGNLGEVPYPDYIRFDWKAYCSGSNCGTVSSRFLDIQFSHDLTNWSATRQVTVANGSEGSGSECGDGGATCTAGHFWTTARVERASKTWASSLIFNSGVSANATFTDAAACNALRIGDQFYVRGETLTIASLACGGTPSMVMSGAIDLTAPGGMTGWPFSYATGWDTNAKLSFRIRKNSTSANANLRVQYSSFYMGRSDRGVGNSGGFARQCSNVARASGRYLCVTGDRIYSFHPTTGEVHLLGGTFQLNNIGGNGIAASSRGSTFGGNGTAWDTSNPDRFWTIGQECVTTTEVCDTPGPKIVVRCDYTGADDTADFVWPDGSEIPTPPLTCVNITPSSTNNTINTLVSAYDVTYNATLYGGWSVDAVTDQYVLLVGRRNGQDTFTYVAVLYFGNAGVLGSGGTGSIVAGAYIHQMAPSLADHTSLGSAFMHTVYHCSDTNTFFCFGTGMVAKNEKAGNQTFHTDLVSYCSDPPACGTFTPGLPAQAAGTITRVRFSSTFPSGVGSAPTGYQVGDPISDCSSGGCSNVNSVAGDYWHGPVRPGDTLFRFKTPDQPEVLEVVSVHSYSGTYVELSVRRGAGSGYDPAYYSPRVWSAGDAFLSGGNSGITGGLENPIGGGGSVAWDFVCSPNGNIPSCFRWTNWPGGGHQDVRNQYGVAGPDTCTFRYTSMANLSYISNCNSSEARIILRPQTFGGQSTANVGECTESHPSGPSLSGNRIRSLDSHAMIGGGGCFSTLDSSSPATLVSWPVYKFRPNVHTKHFDTLAFVGDRLLRNVSGPGSVITSSASDWWTVCYALLSGECQAGSAVGDVYFSAPNLRPGQRFCTNFSTAVDDVCIGDLPYGAGKMVEYDSQALLDAPAFPAGMPASAQRELTGTFARYKVTPNTHNIKLMPGGQFGYYYGSAGARPDGFLAKVPQNWQPDSIGRGTFAGIPIAVSNAPAGTSRVLVKFGYDEALRCSQNRAEACYAAGAAVSESDPFLWESELTAGSGVACSPGCTVTVPGLADRVVFYQVVYRDAGGAVVFSSGVGVGVAGN